MTGRLEDNKPTDLPTEAIVLEDEEATELSLSQRIGLGVVGNPGLCSLFLACPLLRFLYTGTPVISRQNSIHFGQKHFV